MSQSFNLALLPSDVCDFTLTQAVAAIRHKAVCPEELVRALRARSARFEGFNVFTSLAHDAVLADLNEAGAVADVDFQAGALLGVPLAIKDNVHVAGQPNSAGTKGLERFFPRQDAGVVARLRGAGALFIGKTNMHELSLGVTSQNGFFGDVHNAHDPLRLAGGSSGGSAVAVALGLAYGAIGTDTAGSIRIPAALNAVVGFRPSSGRYPGDGITPVCPTRDMPGPIARTVADVALLDQVLAACDQPLEDVRPDSIRLGVVRDYFFEGIDSQVAALSTEALSRLQAAGVTLVELRMPDLGELNDLVSTAIGFGEFSSAMQAYLAGYHTGLDFDQLVQEISSQDVRYLVEHFIAPGAPHEIPSHVYSEAIHVHRPALRKLFASVFSSHNLDAIVFATTIATAGLRSNEQGLVDMDDWEISANYAYLRNTLPASNAGLPGLTIPMGFTPQGRAVGLEIDGPQASDRRLLAIGQAIESVLAR